MFCTFTILNICSETSGILSVVQQRSVQLSSVTVPAMISQDVLDTLDDDPAKDMLKALVQRVDNPDTPADVREAVKKLWDFNDKRDKYTKKMTYPSSECTQAILDMTCTMPWEKLFKDGDMGQLISPNWISAPCQDKLLQFLIRAQNAKSALEIGMLTGFATMAMAEALPEDGVVVACELEPYLVQLGRKTFSRSPHGKKIEIREGKASAILDQLASEGRSFDVVYVDADKEGYLGYFKQLLDTGLLAPKGTLVVDNALGISTAFLEPGGYADEYNIAVMADDRVEQIMLPMPDGVALIRRKGE